MGHRDNVRTIKEAFKTINVKKWEAGDAALAEVPKGTTGTHSGAEDQLRALAEEAGVEFDALRVYRDVAAAWPATTRVVAAHWSVHRELMGFKPMPEETSKWLKNFIKQNEKQSRIPGKKVGKATVDQVRRARGMKGMPRLADFPRSSGGGGGVGNGNGGYSNSSAPSTPVDVDAVKAALADPQVAAAIVNDPTAGGVIAHAQNEMIDTLKSQAKTAQKKREPGLVSNTEYLAVCGRLRSARYQLVQALETVRGIDPITQKIKDGVLEDVEEVQLILDWLKSYLNTQDESFDDALQKLLREGA